jgi:hypothetical protein
MTGTRIALDSVLVFNLFLCNSEWTIEHNKKLIQKKNYVNGGDFWLVSCLIDFDQVKILLYDN